MRVALTLEQCWHRVPGGTAWAAVGLVQGLRELARPDVEVVGVSARHRRPPADPQWVPAIEVRSLPLPRPLLYETWHRWGWPAVERATGRVDVVHATGMAVPGTAAPLVVTVHDLAFLDAPDRATRHGLRFFLRSTELARERADLVICPSAATARQCADNGFDRDRLRIVPHGVGEHPASPDDIARVAARYSLARPYVLFVGAVEPRKNLRRVVQAFGRADSAGHELVLAGPAGWNEDVQSLVTGLDGRVRAIGFVPRAELRALYAGAAAFLFPSLAEGFGLPVLEAMAQGTPVVTSRGTATEEVAGDAAVLVDPLDVDDIAGGLSRLLGDPALAERLGSDGRARAAEFPWTRTAATTLAVYQEAMAA